MRHAASVIRCGDVPDVVSFEFRLGAKLLHPMPGMPEVVSAYICRSSCTPTYFRRLLPTSTTSYLGVLY